jgi:hypothetical protein
MIKRRSVVLALLAGVSLASATVAAENPPPLTQQPALLASVCLSWAAVGFNLTHLGLDY